MVLLVFRLVTTYLRMTEFIPRIRRGWFDELLYTHPKVKESTGADLVTLEDNFFDNEFYFCIEMIRRKTAKTERVSTGSVKYAMSTFERKYRN